MELPLFLDKDFIIKENCTLELPVLYVGLLHIVAGLPQYVSVFDTPHYFFARHVLFGERIKPISGYLDYAHYAKVNSHAWSENKFVGLISSISESGYKFEQHPIFVFRHWRRPLPIGRWDMDDGFHRLAVLAALGKTEISVRTLRAKNTSMNRLLCRAKVFIEMGNRRV